MFVPAIMNALGARACGSGWVARCPAHDDRTPSLSIGIGDNGKVLVRCHAGCEQEAVIAELIRRGLWHDDGGGFNDGNRRYYRSAAKPTPSGQDKTPFAQSIWLNSVPAQGTLAEIYLRSRGIILPIPDTIRFHGGLKHPSGDRWPAMVALVTDRPGGEFLGIHRTFLSRDGSSKAPVDPQKMMLGACGGGAVWLTRERCPLVVGEGIETTLSAMQLWNMSGCAALSAGGMERLPLYGLNDRVLIAADNDKAGLAAAALLEKRLWAVKKGARVLRPQAPYNDFNDVIQVRAQMEAVHV